MTIAEFVEQLAGDDRIAPWIVHRRRLEAGAGTFADVDPPLPEALERALRGAGVERLYAHQAEALQAARRGENVLTVTPTASGKTLVFALPVLESWFRSRRGRALFLYPTKALAQDQLAGLREIAWSMSPLEPPRFEIYDGDTPTHLRRKIKRDPSEALITNPDMLHLGILAHHADWAGFFRELRWVVLDELHVYRGVFGAHVHHILRRLKRICAEHGSSPRFIATSATIGNPREFAETLVGEPFTVVERSGAPRSAREVVFLNPSGVSPYTAAVRVIGAAVSAGWRTIAFTKARRTTELLHTWLLRQRPELAGAIAPYRAGYLPEERREIESRLFRGELKAVLTTSALELGIDVGALDVCVLVGYPGSLTSAWQRIGRVGRGRREALVVMIAMPDALDQYWARHPEPFYEGPFEKAVLDPWNPKVAGKHLVCAAAESPWTRGQLDEAGPAARAIADGLVGEGSLALDAAGSRWLSYRRRPHRDVSPRASAEPFSIVDARDERVLGSIDGMRVYHECHPEAVYLHGGRSYRVLDLDPELRRVTVEARRLDYYTVVLGEKETEVLELLRERPLGGRRAGFGRFKVTVRIRGFQKKRLSGGETFAEHPLTAPPLIFETTGLWMELPAALSRRMAERELHFMGGLHATEHAMIGLLPLLAIADRGDVGGISYTLHPQIGGPTIFLYDGVAGGAGLCERVFDDLERLIETTRDHVEACPCEGGCPSCVHSPRCGNGNKPLDKTAALTVMDSLLGREAIDLADEELSPEEWAGLRPAGRPEGKHGIGRAPVMLPGPVPTVAPERQRPPVDLEGGLLILDVETQRSADEVGGWHRIARMGLALAVVYDVRRRQYQTYFESDVHRLLLDLVMADRVVGFNIERFDLEVLASYTGWDLRRIRTLDMMQELYQRLGFRLSLEHLVQVNLGESKGGDGMQSLRWWREGRLDLIEAYCRRDVELTNRLFRLGRERGYLLYRRKDEQTLRVPVTW